MKPQTLDSLTIGNVTDKLINVKMIHSIAQTSAIKKNGFLHLLTLTICTIIVIETILNKLITRRNIKMGFEQTTSAPRTLSLGGAIPTPAPAVSSPPPLAAHTLQLVKADQLVLVKATGNVEQIKFGGGWDPADTGKKWDLDLAAVILDANGKSRMGKFVCFDEKYRRTEENAIFHNGDNQTGKGEGIDEVIDINFLNLTSADVKVKLFVHIHNAQSNGQHFGLVRNAFCQLDEMNKEQLARFSLTGDYSGFSAIELGDFDRSGTSWAFTAIGRGMNEETNETLGRYL
jgi:tellurium resistance protein TerD